MNYILVHFSLNQVYSIEKSAVEQVVAKTFAKLDGGTKIKAVEITFGNSPSDLIIDVKLDLNVKANLKVTIEKQISSIEEQIINLTGMRPKNISMEISTFN